MTQGLAVPQHKLIKPERRKLISSKRKFMIGAAAAMICAPSIVRALTKNVQTALLINCANETGYDPTGVSDSTSAINSAISKIPASGGRLHIPGSPKTSGGHTLANPTLVQGDGRGTFGDTGVRVPIGAATQINCTSTNGPLFTVTAPYARFTNFGANGPGLETDGSCAILVNSPTLVGQEVDIDYISTNNFYRAIDFRVATFFTVASCGLWNWVYIGVQTRNVLNSDAGDWAIHDCNIVTGNNGAGGYNVGIAGIYCGAVGGVGSGSNSGGSGRILANKIQGINGFAALLNAIVFDGIGGQGHIVGNNMEHVVTGVSLLRRYYYVNVEDNLFITEGGTNPAIICDHVVYSVIANNVFMANSAASVPAINFTGSGGANSDSATISGNFVEVDSGASWPFEVGSTVASSIALTSAMVVPFGSLPAANCLAPGSRTTINNCNTVTYGATANGSGSSTTPVHTDGSSNWIVG